MEKQENKELCSKCGGKCCKKSGCDYLPKDFESLNQKDLLEILSTGNISIVALVKFERIKEKLISIPYLYLRARNTNRDVVDLVSFKTQCSMLTETGCAYDINERPSGGVNLVPKENEMCYPKEDLRELMKDWDRYQKVLEKCVKKITHMSVEERFKEDIENLFYDLLADNIEGVSDIEIQDMGELVPLLMQSNQEEMINANKRYDKDKFMKRK